MSQGRGNSELPRTEIAKKEDRVFENIAITRIDERE